MTVGEALEKARISFLSWPARLIYALRWFSLQLADEIHAAFEKPLDINASPVFIVGCGHSGTTLMAALLNAHPDTNVIKGESLMFRFRCRPKHIHHKLETVGLDAKKIVEKTPRHIRYINRIFRLYPNAKVVVMLRDGRDVACSIRERTGHLVRGGVRWMMDYRILAGFREDSRVEVVRLEDLQTDPLRTMRFVLDFVGLDWRDDLLERHGRIGFDYYGIRERGKFESASKHALKRAEQVNNPIKPSQPRWPTELTRTEAYLLVGLIGAYLVEAGYESDTGSWVNSVERPNP